MDDPQMSLRVFLSRHSVRVQRKSFRVPVSPRLRVFFNPRLRVFPK